MHGGGGMMTDMPAEYIGHVVSNPRAELPVNNAKYIRNCTELHMARRKIEYLWGFHLFVNLEELWLNDNKLQALENLEANFRLKKVYAHNNQIRSLRDSLQHCKFLNTLIVSNNRITDMKETVEDLAGFQYLHELELSGNPLAEEPGYRLYVIHKLPSLHVFDRHVVTPQERTAAAKKFARKRRNRRGSAQSGSAMGGSTASAAGAGAGAGAGGGAGAGAGAAPPAASRTKRRDPKQKQPLTKLEADLAREVARIKRDKTASDLAELEKAYAAGVRKRPDKEPVLESAAMSMSRTLLAEQAANGGGGGDDDENAGPALSEWDIFRLHQVFKAIDTDHSGALSKTEFRHGIAEAKDQGLELKIDTNEELETYFKAMDKDGDNTVGVREFIMAVQGQLYDEQGNLLPPLNFQELSKDDAKLRSDFLYGKAMDIQKQLLPMPDDDPRRPKLEQQIFRLTEKAGRLAALAEKEASSRKPLRRPGDVVPPQRRKDYVTFISNVRRRRDPVKNATVTAVDSGSDSDSDDEPYKAPDTKLTTMRQLRRTRKPRRVMTSSVVL